MIRLNFIANARLYCFYYNFGLREKDNELWISLLVELGDQFFPWHDGHPLGRPKVDSASAWFKQALLIDERTRKPTELVDLFRKLGAESAIGWEFVWIALVNNAVLLKWFVTATDMDEPYSIEKLSQMLECSYNSLGQSTIKGGLAALKDMLTKSPLSGADAITSLEMKGKTVKSITRKAKSTNSLTILYSIYLIAAKADRSSFTVRELLAADNESIYVSPIVAFGITPDMFKKQCEGLKSRYPDYIETTFTFGLDELTVFPKKYTTKDIITLAMGE